MLAPFLCGSGVSENSMAPKPLASRGHSCLLPLLAVPTPSLFVLFVGSDAQLLCLTALLTSVLTLALLTHPSTAASCPSCPPPAHAPLAVLSGIKHAPESCFSLSDGSCPALSPLMSPSPLILISPLSPAPLPLTDLSGFPGTLYCSASSLLSGALTQAGSSALLPFTHTCPLPRQRMLPVLQSLWIPLP